MRHPAALIRRLTILPLVLSLALSSMGCSKDRIKRALGGDVNADTRWGSDSAFLASDAEVLFKVFETETGTEIAPVGAIGPRGFRNMRMGSRGWRAFDIQYLREGQTLLAYKDGKTVGPVKMNRGMWTDNAPALDSLPGCDLLVPSALAKVPDGVRLFTAHARPPIAPGKSATEAEIAEALRTTGFLIATKKGIPVSALPRYKRTVHLVNSGHGTKPSIVVVYNDPDVYPDSLVPDGQRPRNLVVILDWAIWGYKPTWTYSTLGSNNSPPRMVYLDYLDVNFDGKAEVLFGIENKTDPLYLIIVRRDPPYWIEETRQNRRRCQSTL